MRAFWVRFLLLVSFCLAVCLPARRAGFRTHCGDGNRFQRRDGSGSVSVRVIEHADQRRRESTLPTSRAVSSRTISHPALYRVEADATGFKHFVQTGITVRVGDTLEIPHQAGTREPPPNPVTVTGEAPLLQTATSSTGAVIETKLIGDLPLNERQPFTLAVLAPGVIPNRQIVNAAQPFNRAPNFSISGGRGDTNEILLDGTPNTIPEGSTGMLRAVTIFPTVEGMQEFKVQTNSMSAEYGGSGGGIVNIVTKAGTNEYHGAAFEFLRNSAMDSNGFFSNANKIAAGQFQTKPVRRGVRRTDDPSQALQRQEQYVLLRVSWEDLRQLGGIPFTTSVPTDLQRMGDFSQTFTATGAPIVIYDPSTTALNQRHLQRTPFAGNVIPSNRINPIAQKIMALFPEPTGLGLPFTHASNFNKTYTQTIDDNRVDVRVDQNFGDKQRVYFSYAKDNRTYKNPNVYGNISDPIQFTYPTDPWSWRAGYLYTISPTWVAEARFAHNSIFYGQQPGSLGYDISQLGFPANVVSGVQEKEFPRLTFSDLTGTQQGMGPISNTMTGHQNSNVVPGQSEPYHRQSRDQIRNASPPRLRQPIHQHAGRSELRVLAHLHAGSQCAGRFEHRGQFRCRRAAGARGYGQHIAPEPGHRHLTHNWWQSYYVQDDWRVSRRLTINVGLRWDLQFPMVEQNNNFNWFTPNVTSPIARRCRA